MYHYDNPRYNIYPGMIYSQDLYMWCHWGSSPKWYYAKDSRPNEWAYFYKARHNPPSEEKIVDLIDYHDSKAGQNQLWALYKEI